MPCRVPQTVARSHFARVAACLDFAAEEARRARRDARHERRRAAALARALREVMREDRLRGRSRKLAAEIDEAAARVPAGKGSSAAWSALECATASVAAGVVASAAAAGAFYLWTGRRPRHLLRLAW